MRESYHEFNERQKAEHARAYNEWRAKVMEKFDNNELTPTQGASVVRQLKSEDLARSVVSKSVDALAERIAADVTAQVLEKRAEAVRRAAKRATVAKRATATTMVDRGFWRNPGEEAPAPEPVAKARAAATDAGKSIWTDVVYG